MRRAQIAKLLTTIPLMVVIVLIMGLFFVAVYWLSSSKNVASSVSLSSPVPEASLLVQSLSLRGTSLSVLEGLILTYGGVYSEQEFLDALRPIARVLVPASVSEGIPCVLVSITEQNASRNGFVTYFLPETEYDSKGIFPGAWTRFSTFQPPLFHPLQPSARVFLTLDQRMFELRAYAGACSYA